MFSQYYQYSIYIVHYTFIHATQYISIISKDTIYILYIYLFYILVFYHYTMYKQYSTVQYKGVKRPRCTGQLNCYCTLLKV